MNIAVVIPAYGATPHLADILDAIGNGILQPTQIIVSHSGEHNPEPALAQRYPAVRFLHSKNRLFAGEARNRGAAIIDAQVIAFCDSDVLPDAAWLKHLIEPICNDHDVFAVGAVGVARSGGYWGMANWLCEFSEQAPFRPTGQQAGGASCNMAVRLELFQEIGGFQENQHVSEDTLLFATLRGRGARQTFVSEAIVAHYNHTGFSAFFRHQLQLGKGFPASRRIRPELPGSALTKNPITALLLGVPKAFWVVSRMWKGGAHWRWRALWFSPAILIGCMGWSLGAAKEAAKSHHQPD